MTSLPPVKDNEAGPEAKALFDDMKKKIGKMPNVYAVAAHSPRTLKAFLEFKNSVGQGEFSAKEAEAVALVMGEVNGCRYCLCAHTVIAKMAGLTEEETVAVRRGGIADPKLQALVGLTRELAETKGHPSPQTVDVFLAAGYTQAALVELVAWVSLNVFTNYLNHLADTPLDFPACPEI